FEAILQRVQDVGLKGLAEDERQALLALPFKLIAARHRLGLIDEGFEARVIEARRHFAAHLPRELRGAIEFFDPARYNSAASLQDNILFGKIVTGQAEAATRMGALLREVLEEQRLRPEVIRVGLAYQVGVGGGRLASADRQKIAVARALLKRPVVLVFDAAISSLDPASQNRVVTNILEYRKGRGVIWALARHDLGERFARVLVLDRGRLMEQGRFQELKTAGGALQRMLGAG
ncbi:MAG: ABC transporter ATP-binding protein, partial [Betaproteobacteria bacterium]